KISVQRAHPAIHEPDGKTHESQPARALFRAFPHAGRRRVPPGRRLLATQRTGARPLGPARPARRRAGRAAGASGRERAVRTWLATVPADPGAGSAGTADTA